MSVIRLFVERKEKYRVQAAAKKASLEKFLKISIEDLRIVNRFDVEGLSLKQIETLTNSVFADASIDEVTLASQPSLGAEYSVIAVEFLPSQYDQREDFCAQTASMATGVEGVLVSYATIYAFKGVKASDLDKLKKYLINPVEAQVAATDVPQTLKDHFAPPAPVAMVDGFIDFDAKKLVAYHKEADFAMSIEDLAHVQNHFKKIYRNPTVLELKAIDTYWSDRCRHTTFLTRLKNVVIKSDIAAISDTFEQYLALFNKHYNGRADKYPSLMDIATMGARELRSRGKLDNVEICEETNACTMFVEADVDGKQEDWKVMFNHEMHSHSAEIEPYGGAATVLGSAMKDPLSGRGYVYHSMRVTGAADSNTPFKNTLKNKLPQRYLTQTAADGFSSYANLVGLAGGIVQEYYHAGYAAKRMEASFTVAAAPVQNVIKSKPEPGDVVLYIGGATGRDGCGGAMGCGKSKSHTDKSMLEDSAQVQKGTPIIARKLQRLYRNPEFSTRVKRSSNFGAGGVSVAVGGLSEGLEIQLDKVPTQCAGLSATEIAISESQERMAVVVAAKDVAKVTELAAAENLNAYSIATVSDSGHMRMYYHGNMVLDIQRAFLNTNGVAQTQSAKITEKPVNYFTSLDKRVAAVYKKGVAAALKASLALSGVASQKGMAEMFDSTSGGGSVFTPLGGKNRLTPAINMAAKLPLLQGETDTCTVCAHGYNPDLFSESPFTGAVYAVLSSIVKVVVAGVPLNTIRLTFQEYFEKLRDEDLRWGKPVSALLGSLYTQLGLEIASVGGKGSIDGTHEKLDVPPTLISFAIGMGKASQLITNVFNNSGKKVYRYKLQKDVACIPNMEITKEFLNLLQGEIGRGLVDFATVVEVGGVASAIAKSCMGNGLGFTFNHADASLFTPDHGDILFTTDTPDDFVGHGIELVGEVTPDGDFVFGNGDTLSQADAVASFTGTFEEMFPTSKRAQTDKIENFTFNQADNQTAKKPATKKGKKPNASPLVIIPVMADTNGEYEMARKFLEEGAEVITPVMRNHTAQEATKSFADLAKLIKKAQIFVLPNGFSSSKEPEISDVFATTLLQRAEIATEINALIERGGLVLGVNTGFGALLKTGLLMHGKLGVNTTNVPTLTHNSMGKPVSGLFTVRIASNLSPWLKGVEVGSVVAMPMCTSTGQFVASCDAIDSLVKNGQVVAQFADANGNATMASPANPTGAKRAIAAVCSPCGSILGTTFNPERTGGKNLYKNTPESTELNIFKNAVENFK